MGKRRHRRRRDGSGSRAGTPLRDELDAPPTEPRRPPPPRERPPLPMSLPLPKFAAQLLRSASTAPRQSTAPASAPDSPPRPPSAGSSSDVSPPLSPSSNLDERIKSLDEKYEKWTGSRAHPDAPDRARLKHRLLDVDINEVKPSEVVRSLLAKRSVFDEDSERLEGATRAPSPSGSPRGRPPPSVPRALRYPFPAHPSPHSSPATPSTPATPLTPATPTSCSTAGPGSHSSQDPDSEMSDRPVDPRLNRPERTFPLERLGKISESDYRLESNNRLRRPSTDKSQPESSDRRQSTGGEHERPDKLELERDPRRGLERRRRNSLYGSREGDSRLSLNSDDRDIREAIERINPDYQTSERISSCNQDKRKSEESSNDKPFSLFAENIDVCKEGDNINIERNVTRKQVDSSRETEPSLNQDELGNITEKDSEQSLGHSDDIFVNCEGAKSDMTINDENVHHNVETDLDKIELPPDKDDDKCMDILMQNHINKELHEFEVQNSHLNIMNTTKPTKELAELPQEFIKTNDKNGNDRYDQNVIIETFHDNKSEKENIEFDKSTEKDKMSIFSGDKKNSESEKHFEDRVKHDREKAKHSKEKHEHDKEKSKNHKNDRPSDRTEKEKKSKEDVDKTHVDKTEKTKETEKSKHEEKTSRHEHHKKDKRKDNSEGDGVKTKKDEKQKHEKTKKDESKRENKKESETFKNRKTSRDEPPKDLCRKDSTDSSTSRASYDSSKLKELDQTEIKEESKPKLKYFDLFANHEKYVDKEYFKSLDLAKTDGLKLKSEIKEDLSEHNLNKVDTDVDTTFKCKPDVIEKQRHYSLDSPSLDSKRKERLNSCSSLPSNIGHKRRMSSQECVDSFHDENKKSKSDSKCPERRDSKDSRSSDKHKTTKFNKGHFAKIIESKTKDDKKNQVKPPDDIFPETKNHDSKDQRKSSKKNSPTDYEERANPNNDLQPERLQHDLDFLATLELRSSEEDERQKALRKEMKEKKRIQQLQQIQELQMQQDALHQAELMGKLKDDKKQKSDEKKKEAAREKRMSTDRKSREEKSDSGKRKNRKQLQSTDSSDSDEPKKHSIFDIVDDGPTYISMYDKVKARSCKNMQKQEEEKRQEKIKAKFSQLKQSRAKREEKKRSSWDEDSDSDHERRKPQKLSMDSSSDDDQIVINNKKREKIHRSSLDYDRFKTNDYFSTPSNEEDSRNKLSRKNSRTRIISDTSDDEISKRSISKSPSRKEFLSDFESLQRIRDEDGPIKETSDKIKKNSLLNLFGKSDSDDSKLKNSELNENRPSFMKSLTGDFSSESESAVSSRIAGEVRKKHKKKQKKHKFTYSDDESKIESSDAMAMEGETKHKRSDKLRHHGNKKEKRKEKIRDSFEADENRESKHRKDKKSNNCFDSVMETSINNKKDGKMEDIFGPLSDESDKDTTRLDYSNHGYDSAISLNDQTNSIINEDSKSKDKEDNKRKRDKKRKEKRTTFVKDDDNSLDVDAVSKAIEARLFADSVDDDSRIRTASPLEILSSNQQPNMFDYSDGDVITYKDKHSERVRRESKEKKKKKKKNKEDRQNRKEHHHHHHHHHHNNIDRNDRIDYLSEKVEELSPKMLLDIPLPNDNDPSNSAQRSNDLESPSLPSLTDSPPGLPRSNDSKDSPEIKIEMLEDSVDHSIEIEYDSEKSIAIMNIPMPPPYENVVQDISEVPLPADPVPISELCKAENFFSRDLDVSEDAVRSISNLEKETDKTLDKSDALALKVSDKKLDEKPRAVISQEETEDAVAALLGESFGGKDDNFPICYEEVESNPTHEIEIESSTIANENIPEEDAEEMRQAVQNLNASEMEIKPDTPVSDSDLLLIDTDTEEADEPAHDAIDQLPVNIIATNQALNNTTDHTKSSDTSSTPVLKDKVPSQPSNVNESDVKIKLPKKEAVPQATSTATPVITSWTMSKNKLIEPHVLNASSCQHSNRETNETKATHITANIVQIKAPQTQGTNAPMRPVITPNRANANAPYQVVNHMIRPQLTNMQPPTIKIPPQEPHILYSKPPGIVISPRMINDTRQSPKLSPQGEGISSPRLNNMTILSTSPQNLNSVGLASPNAIQQRSPGQVTVVRMQQPPLSPIQAMHIPHGARTMVSPNRPNSVLVQTQGSPIHFNRLPVTPVLAPISKMSLNSAVQPNKSIVVSSSSMIHQPKIITGESRKNDQRNIIDNENSKIILSPTALQHSTNPTVMAQNRLISMQNAMHAGNVNPNLQLPNKVLLNNVNHLADKIDGLLQKSEQHSHLPFGSTPIIHVAGANHLTPSIIHSSSKAATTQETSSISRAQSSNVIHTINSQRLLTTATISNVIQIDANKAPPSVLSMANIRSPTVLTKLESSKSSAVTTACLKNVVMTPLLLKTSSPGTIRLTPKNETEQLAEIHSVKLQNHVQTTEDKSDQKTEPSKLPNTSYDKTKKQKDSGLKPVLSPQDNLAKDETDFEELLKDKTNEIKVTNNPEKKLEVNVGKTVTLFSTNIQHRERKSSKESAKIEQTEENASIKTENLIKASDFKEKDFLSQQQNEENVATRDNANANIENVKESSPLLDKKVARESVFVPLNIEERPSIEKCFSDSESNYDTIISKTDGIDNQLKCLDENDSWSAKDVNIESVIKKVDSLCNDNLESDSKEEPTENVNDTNVEGALKTSDSSNVSETCEPVELQADNRNIFDLHSECASDDRTTINKRGGRNARGRRSEKNDRVQTRQISKPSRGTTSAKRGRGRAKVDKKIKSLVNHTVNNLPGDVYDFHEDSGDETSTSPNKTEPRPRLILTIKSPLSGQSNAIATSSLSITQKDQLKNPDKITNDKPEDFVSPSANTRKSRRLQEKDVQRNTVDDVIEDVVKGGTGQVKLGKDNKKRQTRQTGPKTIQDKAAISDTRKSPRGVKRSRDRSLSDASVDSSDEKVIKRDDAPKEMKIPKIAEPPAASKTEPDPPQPAKTIAPTPVQLTNSTPISTPTPIIKPPKKMISEISAKLASVFEAAAAATPSMRMQVSTERIPMEIDKPAQGSLREPRSAEIATAMPAVLEPVAAATGNARGKESKKF